MYLVKGFFTFVWANCAQNMKKAIPNEEKEPNQGRKLLQLIKRKEKF